MTEPAERLTTYQAIPVEVSSSLSAGGALVRTPMVLLAASEFAEIEGLLDEACDQLAILSAGVVERGGMGYSTAEEPAVLAEAEDLWGRLRERIAESR